jgi:hypothetical protein
MAIRAWKLTNFKAMEAAMNRGRMVTKAIPLLIGIGLFLSACAVEPDYGAPAYAYDDPIYGSLDFDYGGWGGGWHHGWDHGHGELGHEAHGGWGHGFAGHAGFSGHGGFGGHGGGGHR